MYYNHEKSLLIKLLKQQKNKNLMPEAMYVIFLQKDFLERKHQAFLTSYLTVFFVHYRLHMQLTGCFFILKNLAKEFQKHHLFKAFNYSTEFFEISNSILPFLRFHFFPKCAHGSAPFRPAFQAFVQKTSEAKNIQK